MAVGVSCGWGEDLAAGASDVDAWSEPAGLVVADLVGGGEVDVSAAGGGEGGECVGEWTVDGFEVLEGFGA